MAQEIGDDNHVSYPRRGYLHVCETFCRQPGLDRGELWDRPVRPGAVGSPVGLESPEIIAVAIFALKGRGPAAMSALVSSKVNQWTLLIGSLALAYSISLGHVGALAMDSRQVEELVLTSAQTIFAVALIANLRFSVKEADTFWFSSPGSFSYRLPPYATVSRRFISPQPSLS